MLEIVFEPYNTCAMAYEQNGIFPEEKLLLTYETRMNPINQKVIKNLIEHYLK